MGPRMARSAQFARMSALVSNLAEDRKMPGGCNACLNFRMDWRMHAIPGYWRQRAKLLSFLTMIRWPIRTFSSACCKPTTKQVQTLLAGALKYAGMLLGHIG